MKKIEEAVQETSGQILTYGGTRLMLRFFQPAMDLQKTLRRSGRIHLPYLKSVESPWDKNSPKFSGKKVDSKFTDLKQN